MLLLAPVVVACVAALLFGGSLQRLATLDIRHGWLILLSLFLQVGIYLPPLRHSSLVLGHAQVLYLTALALALLGMASNRHLGLPLLCAMLGLVLNFTVIAANGAHMPVNAAALRATLGPQAIVTATDPYIYTNTRLAGPSTRLLLLSDVLPVHVPGYGGNVYSVGDILLTSGLAVLVFRTVRGGAPAPSTAQDRAHSPHRAPAKTDPHEPERLPGQEIEQAYSAAIHGLQRPP